MVPVILLLKDMNTVFDFQLGKFHIYLLVQLLGDSSHIQLLGSYFIVVDRVLGPNEGRYIFHFTITVFSLIVFVMKCRSSVIQVKFPWSIPLAYGEEFEDTKGAIRICISKKNRQHNGQKKKYKRTNNDQQNIHIKLKIE